MSIQLNTQPITASAKLSAEDISALKSALQPLLTLPASQSDLSNLIALGVNVQPDGSGVINVRFSK